MPQKSAMSGTAIALILGGAYAAWVGINDVSLLEGLKSFLRGEMPAKNLGKQFAGFGQDLGSGIGAGGALAGAGTALGASGSGSAIANAALSHVGTPYKWGGADPSGFDCSGLVYYVFVHDLGLVPASKMPRTTMTEITSSLFRKVSRKEISAGDLTWWPTHVGIAINNVQGVYAPSTGKTVQVQNIDGGRPPGMVGLRFVPQNPSGKGATL